VPFLQRKQGETDMTQQNMAAAHMFIEALAGSMDAQMTFQTFDDNAKRKDRSLTKVINGTLSQAWPELVRLNNLGAGIFATINETDQTGRKEENIRRRRAYFADFDLKQGEIPFDKAEQLIEPTLAVESSPGKIHAYWKLTADVPPDQWKRTQAAIISKFHTDPQCKDQSRVLRLPGMFHRKADPFMVSIKKIGGPEYAHSTIETVFRAAEKPTQEGPLELVKKNQKTGDSRRNQLASVTGQLLNEGVTKHLEIMAHLNQFAKDNFDPSDPVDWENIGALVKGLIKKHKDAPEPFVRSEQDTGCDLADLVQKEFEPFRFVCYPFICEGYTIYVGKPKIGKTTLMRQLIVAANGGGSFMGFDCNKTSCLFISLEESQRQFKKKILEMNYSLEELRGIRVEWKWPRGDAAISELRLYLHANPDTKLIIIDSLSSIKGENDRNKVLFQNDYDFGQQLEQVCKDHPGLAIIAIHHTRKMESEDPADLVSGSNGVTAACTTFCVLHKVPTGYAMHWEGRNWPEDHHSYEIARDSGRWRFIGVLDEAMEKLAPNATGQAAIITYMRERGTVTQKSIARDLNIAQQTVSEGLRKLKELGIVYKDELGYRLL
jgi:DNA-binding transcriptional ArsR family regulator